MTRDDFLARCANAWDTGTLTPERIHLLHRWVELVMRLEGGQMDIVTEILANEKERLGGIHKQQTLAGDRDGYALFQLAAILSHHCQVCATDPKAWWTRPGFCPHRSGETVK